MTDLISRTVRPGLLVSLNTSLTGNVNYQKTLIESDRKTESGAVVKEWNTTRTIYDPEEHERAVKARGKAAALVRAVCAKSDFGLLCPEADEDKLRAAIKEARRVANEFNATASLSHIGVFVITGKVAPDDVEAVKSINSEIKGLLDAMARGIEKLDVKAIRDAANAARSVGQMLPVETQTRVKMAIEAARAAARQLVKAGDQAAEVVNTSELRKITEARTAFLDIDQDAIEIAAPTAETRAIDLEPVAAMATPIAAQAAVVEF